jgi:uncharacterized membrane protein
MRWSYFAVIALAGAALALANPGRASAGTPLHLCNQSPARIIVTYGFYSSGVNDTTGSQVLTGPFVSKGFRTIEPGACSNLENPFNARYMFWWAANYVGTLNSNGPNEWAASGNYHFCTPNVYGAGQAPEFTFEDENASADECTQSRTKAGANIWVRARRVDVMVEPTVNFDG